MTRLFLSRLRWALAVAALSASSASADPIIITSGRFALPFGDVSFFQFFGADGFRLNAGFLNTTVSAQRTCFEGCAPGTVVNLSVVTGGQAATPPFSIGVPFDSNINGTPFFTSFPRGRLVGTLRFDAPTVVLPPASEGAANMGAGFGGPFVFNGQVTGFAPDDPEGRVPLFDVALVGQGRFFVQFDEFSNGLYSDVDQGFTFTATAAPIPEPATLLLFSTGLIGVAARKAWRHQTNTA